MQYLKLDFHSPSRIGISAETSLLENVMSCATAVMTLVTPLVSDSELTMLPFRYQSQCFNHSSKYADPSLYTSPVCRIAGEHYS